jgi:hypothetical protein
VSLPRVDLILGAASGVTNIVGAKIYRTQAPQDTIPPYVVWGTVSAAPENNLASDPETDEARLQIDCYVTKDSQAQGVALNKAAVAALEAYYHVIFGPIESKEDQTEYWRWMFHINTFTDR